MTANDALMESIWNHLNDAELLMEEARNHLNDAVLVAAAEVHARIAHAMTALAMVRPVEPAEAPGLAVLERLAGAMERIAEAVDRGNGYLRVVGEHSGVAKGGPGMGGRTEP